MKKPLIIAIVLIKIIVIVFIIMEFKKEKKMVGNPDEVVLENILTRKSVRRYLKKPVEKDKIEKILRAGMSAPTAGNKQPWMFIVVDDKEVLKEMSEALPYAKMIANAPVAIVVCGDLSKGFKGVEAEYWVQDCSAASQNILLAAHALGLGAVWTGVYPMPERMKSVSKTLGLQEGIIPLNVIPVGYSDGIVEHKDKWTPENIRWVSEGSVSQ